MAMVPPLEHVGHYVQPRDVGQNRRISATEIISVAPPAEPRGEKKLFFVQIFGGEKLLKFGEKWAVKKI